MPKNDFLDPSNVNQESLEKIIDMLQNLPDRLQEFKDKKDAEYRFAFEAALDRDYVRWTKDSDGAYVPVSVEHMWHGWKMCMEHKKPIRFLDGEIYLPADKEKRMSFVESLSKVFACYLTQMLCTWPKDHVRMKSVFESVELACASASSVLSEEEYAAFAHPLVDDDFNAKKRILAN